MDLHEVALDNTQQKTGNDQWLDELIRLAQPDHEKGVCRISMSGEITHGLESCYQYCSQVTEHHSKSFFMASGLLPREKKEAVRALYAFCRTTDDIVDMSSDEGGILLGRWRKDVLGKTIRFNDPVVIAWADTREKFQVPDVYIRQLIEGVEMDLHKNRYRDFEELTKYCYGVASTVGLMSMHIVGFRNEKAIPYAVKLGVALQLTNILRDIEEDWNRGRIYLPQDEMAAFGISENHLEQKINDVRWKNFMKFQIERTRQLYNEAWPGIEMLHLDGRFSIAAAATFYKNILNKIELNDYDVFSHRAALSKWEKLIRIPNLVLRYKYASSLNSFLS